MPKKETVSINNVTVDVYSLNTIVVGSGCAGFNTADCLYSQGQQDIALITEGINKGTSRNTGSDKQTYYKLTLAGNVPDSIGEMAQTYFNGGAMHGDIALVEAALSAPCFSKLAAIGVPFPHNSFGEYVGYKTDHDPRQRATSAGPLTSKFMTEKLQQQVEAKGIPIFNGFQVITLFTKNESNKKQTIGLLAIDLAKTHEPNFGFTLFNCTNIVWATGGPAGMYADSVYPESQTGSTGLAFEAGAKGVNLTESQFGLASTKFRWNVSGTYQQVLPRYISTNQEENDAKEFLNEYFPCSGKILDAIFLKGYQWPFDPRKVADFGSSLIDILVYHETQNKNRRVWLDYRYNPSLCCNHSGELDFNLCGQETLVYLKKSNALFGKPIDRLEHMNPSAVQLYKDHGIDLHTEMLEIAVCAQHNNGGLLADIWSQSNIKHFFPVGEASGVFGIYRPGGSALNSTQVSSYRAAQFIAANYPDPPLPIEKFVNAIQQQLAERHKLTSSVLNTEKQNPLHKQCEVLIEQCKAMRRRMTVCGAHIRSLEKIEQAITETHEAIKSFWNETKIERRAEIAQIFKNWDILITQYVYLCAQREYIRKGGRSRGSYLVQDDSGTLPLSEMPGEKLPEEFRFALDDGELSKYICEVTYVNGECRYDWVSVRPIPAREDWFENVWAEYRKGNVFDANMVDC